MIAYNPGVGYDFGVITKVPDPTTDDGNLRSAMTEIFVKVAEAPLTPGRRTVYALLPDVVGAAESLRYMTETYRVGQILILDENGREYAYPGRERPESVTCEHFPTIEEAIARAREVAGSR